jgi:hypothetical protein
MGRSVVHSKSPRTSTRQPWSSQQHRRADDFAIENMTGNSSTPVDSQKAATAYHEAGHAVMGFIVEDPPLFATIEPDNKGAVGKVEFEPGIPEFARQYLNDSPAKRRYAEQRILIELAGTAAHNLLEPGRLSDLGDETDARSAREFADELISWEDKEAYLCRARDEAETRLRAHWPWVEAVAGALLQRKTLSREDILALRPPAAPENRSFGETPQEFSVSEQRGRSPDADNVD